MSSKQPTWREVAVRLGERMRHHSYCPEHPEAESDSDNCPFCADREAFAQYIVKKRSTSPGR